MSDSSEPVSIAGASVPSDSMAAVTNSFFDRQRRYSVAEDTPARTITSLTVNLAYPTSPSTLSVVTEDDGVRQFLVPAGAAGVTVHEQRSLDLVKRYARIEFDGVEVGEDAVVGDVAQTPSLNERQTQIALILQCAEVVGILDTVFGLTVQWAIDRHSFGRPLASYQALKHRFADMKMWLEACRAVTAAAVDEVAARAPDAGVIVSAAKSYLGERSVELVQECVQLHGGIGVTWEHDLHLYLRQITLYRSIFGTPEDHHVRIYQQSKAHPAA